MKRLYALFITFLFLGLYYPSDGQVLNHTNKLFLEEGLIPIEVDSNYRSNNWFPFQEVLSSKRIILLGEANHGSREVFISRNSLIKYLHDTLGFNTILFESGLGELAICELKKSELSPKEMSYGLIGPWQTQEFIELLEYTKASKLSLGGYDVQRSGSGRFKYLLEKEALAANISALEFEHLEEQFGTSKKQLEGRSFKYDSIEKSVNLLILQYQFIHDKILDNNISQAKEKPHQYCIKTLENRIDYLNYMLSFKKTNDWSQRFSTRDSLMASNARWLIETIFPEEKIIIIGHNYHTAKSNPDLPVMGAYLKLHFEDEIYSCGFFSGDGVYTGNNGKPKTTLPVDSTNLDVKHIIKFTESSVKFLNIPANAKPASEFLYQPMIINDSFINLSGANSAVLSELFDGLILIDKSAVPIKP